MSQLGRIGGRRNHRKFPGIKGRRPDKYEDRKETAEANMAAWRALSPEEQLFKLDVRLGKGVGAVKQRARIQKKIAQAGKKVKN